MPELAETGPQLLRRSSTAWGMLFGSFGTVVALARNLLFVPLYLHFITLQEYGAWLATGAALVQLVITDYGLAGVLMQRASRLFGAERRVRLGSIICSGLVMSVGLALLLSLLSLCALPLLPAIKGLNPGQTHQVMNCFLIAVAANAIGVIASTSYGLIRSLQRAIFGGAVMLAADCVNIATTLILLASGAGLYALAEGLLARSAFAAILLVSYLLFICRARLGLALRFRAREVLALLVNSTRFFVSSTTMKLHTLSNTFFVGVVLGPQSAAIYSLTVRAHETILIILGQINSALIPSMAHLLGSGKRDRFRELIFRLAPTLFMMTGVGMAATAVANKGFLSLWVGAGAFAGQPTSMLMAAALWVASLGYVAYDALNAMGRYHLIARTFAICALLHVALLLSLLKLGVWIAPLSSLLTSLIWGYLFWRRLIRDTHPSNSALKAMLADILLIGICGVAVVAAFFSVHIGRLTWVSLFVSSTAVGIVMCVAVTAIGGRLRDIVKEEFFVTWRALVRR